MRAPSVRTRPPSSSRSGRTIVPPWKTSAAIGIPQKPAGPHTRGVFGCAGRRGWYRAGLSEPEASATGAAPVADASGSEASPGGSMPEQELLGVEQRPVHVLPGLALVRGLGDVLQ